MMVAMSAAPSLTRRERLALSVLWVLSAFCLWMSWRVDGPRGLAIALGFAAATAGVLLRLNLPKRTLKGWPVAIAVALSVLVPGQLLFDKFATPVLGAFIGFGIAAPWMLASRTTSFGG